MKRSILLLGLCMLAMACSENDSTTEPETQNKVALLQVDFLTNTFEGGKELSFPEANGFTISSVYHSPGDDGDITLKYKEVNQPLFAGTIFWMATGARQFPDTIDAAPNFATIQNAVAIPALSDFKTVNYDEFAYYPENIDYAQLWNAIDNLKVVEQYRAANPTAKVNLYLYTPSVGVGNPAEWDWIIILKN